MSLLKLAKSKVDNIINCKANFEWCPKTIHEDSLHELFDDIIRRFHEDKFKPFTVTIGGKSYKIEKVPHCKVLERNIVQNLRKDYNNNDEANAAPKSSE